MSSQALPAPGILLGPYPEHDPPVITPTTALAGALRAHLPLVQRTRLLAYRRFADRVVRTEHGLQGLRQSALHQRTLSLRARLRHEGLAEELLVEAFAIIRLAGRRTLGKDAFDTQMIAARIMLDSRLAEMATGEGKTLAAALCAAAAALGGAPVHVVTVNDYLVTRDAALMGPLFAALGLTTGTVTATMDPEARRAAYACDITYCTAPELVFDYLRDRALRVPGQSDLQRRVAMLSTPAAGSTPLLRGLCMAIVDEADSVLIDEARMPLILSGPVPDDGQTGFQKQALDLARRLVPGKDFRPDPVRMQVVLTERGRAQLGEQTRAHRALWRNRQVREETVCTALAALHLYRPDVHYLLRDGKVVIVDESTGRVSPGRIWSRGLHQLIELKEGCELTGGQVTLRQITYQRFFRRYLRLGGMSGTLREARRELAAVYGLEVVPVPLRQPSRRRVLPMRVFPDRHARWQAVVARVRELRRLGRPVLVGTDSVAESEDLSRALAAAGVPHAVLNARQDAAEAAVVAQAGAAGQITVATNMAGRGTDIPLGPGVADAGGLHVISCQHNASGRIDRQLIGRCARQGDPGSAEAFLVLDAPRLAGLAPIIPPHRIPETGWWRPGWLVRLLMALPQQGEERRQRRERAAMLHRDVAIEKDFTLLGCLD
ncbi:MAG: hypothetical protein WCJ69_17730 [Betaproteobacteria bacterium]